MGQTLTNGIYLPAEGERNCYTGLAANWTALDSLIGGYNAHIGNATIHVTAEDKAAWNGKADASALTAHTGDTTIHVTAEDKQAWNGKADASALTAHTGDTTIHVTAEDKATWNGKADASALTAHTGNTTIHVTAEDKAKWDTVTGKANDADVVHKSGAETIAGTKAFSDNTLIYNSDNTANTPTLYLKSSKIEISSRGNTSGDQNLTYLDKNSTAYAYVKGAIQSNGSVVKIRSMAKDSSDNLVINELQLMAYTNGNKAFFPAYSKEIDLGISNYKWKSFNGVEPSSLSMPATTGTIDISSYVTDLTGATVNNYTPLANGYIVITCNSNDVDYIKMSNNLNFVSIVDNTNNQFTSGILGVWQPCVAGVGIQIRIKASALGSAKFIPCKGNV